MHVGRQGTGKVLAERAGVRVTEPRSKPGLMWQWCAKQAPLGRVGRAGWDPDREEKKSGKAVSPVETCQVELPFSLPAGTEPHPKFTIQS